MTPSPLIGADELRGRLGEPRLRIVEGSWRLDGHDTRADHDRAHIPGAVFLDLERVSDRGSPLPHMLPTAEAFAREVGRLGLAADESIVVYGGDGSLSAARIWWMFRIMGARDVRILDGGLAAWRAVGGPLTDAVETPAPAVFRARLDADAVAAADLVLRSLQAGSAQVLDARPAARFTGTAPEPRPGLRSGHMPGAISLPFGRLLAEDGRMLAPDALRQVLAEAGVDPDRPVITSCGSGVTAAWITLALTVLGRGSRLYDGSWSEWGGRDDLPVETG